MRRLFISAVATVCLLSIGMTPTMAQDGPPQFRPLEMWACALNDGKDQDDMDDVYEDIVAAAGDTEYSAFQINPYITGSLGQNIDFIYLGAWANGNVMGADMASYIGNDDDGWDDTVTCQALMFASNWIQMPANPPNEDGTFMMSISDCNVDHGNTAAQAVGAINRFNDYRVANGLTVGTLVWFPLYGGGDAEFDFKVVSVFGGAQEMGDSFQWNVDNASYNMRNSLSEGVFGCDEGRLYTGRTIMNNIPAAN